MCSHPDHVGKETLACPIQLVSSEFGDSVEYLHLHATYLRQQRCHAFFVETVELLVQPRVALPHPIETVGLGLAHTADSTHCRHYDWAAYDLQKCLHSYLEWLWVVTEQNLCNQRNFAGGSTTTGCIFDLEYYMENPCRQLLSWDCYYNPRNKHRGFNQRYTCVYILAFLERSCIFCCNAYSALEFFLCRFTKTVFPDASSAINNSAFSSTNGKVCVVNHGYAVLLFPQYFLVTLRTVLGDLPMVTFSV